MKSKPFFIWQGRTLKKIYPEEIICLYTVKNYTRVYLTDDVYYLVRTTLSSAFKKLPHDIFIKITRSMVVSVHHIDKIQRDHLIIGDKPIPIAKQFYQSFIDKLNIIG